MTFSGNRTGDKETLHHYFPSTTNSYIIFEIYKQQSYCILIKRDTEGDIEYYKIDSEYKEEFFLKEVHEELFKESGKQQKVLRFDEVKSNLAKAGVTFSTFKNKTEVFNFVYQRGKLNPAAVWLEDAVVSDGLSNNFSKVYRYLINSKLINNRTLKDSLIIADSRDKEGINFSQKSRKDINDLLRINDEIKDIRNVQKEFSEFRETVNQYKARIKIISELIYSFNKQYQPSIIENEKQLNQKRKEITETTIKLNETLYPKMQKLDRDIGGRVAELKVNQEQQYEIQKQFDEINSFEGIQFLKQTFINLDEKRKSIESKITRLESQSLSYKQIEQKVSVVTQSVQRIDRQIKNHASQLIYKLTDKQKEREMLNYILSPDFSVNSGVTVKKKIIALNSVMNLFDGQVKLPFNMKGKEILSLKALKEELVSSQKEKEELEKLLPVAKNFEKAQKELDVIIDSIKEVNEKTRKIELKPALDNKLSKLITSFKKTNQEKEKLEKELKVLNEEITKRSLSIQSLTEAKDKLESRIGELRRWKEEMEKISIEPQKTEIVEELNTIYQKIKLHNAERENLKTNKDLTFQNLKHKIKNTIADEELFVKFIEEEIACLPDKEKSIDTILKAISTQFANPAHTLVRRYQEFREFIYNKFNSKLSQTKISDIESLKIELIDNRRIIEDLKKISTIDGQLVLDFDQSENLKILNSYLDTGKKIDFDELFDIELHLTKNGKQRKVDLKEQVESDGTDRMIRLVIIMSVINRLAVNDKENKIVIFIDEIATIDGKNRRELFKFCNEHNFIPICASPDETILDGFDKYYLLLRSRKGGQVNINDKQHVIRQTNLMEHQAN